MAGKYMFGKSSPILATQNGRLYEARRSRRPDQQKRKKKKEREEEGKNCFARPRTPSRRKDRIDTAVAMCAASQKHRRQQKKKKGKEGEGKIFRPILLTWPVQSPTFCHHRKRRTRVGEEREKKRKKEKPSATVASIGSLRVGSSDGYSVITTRSHAS